MRAAFFLLALPSLAVLAALAAREAAETGARRAAAYFATLFAYGAARGLLIRLVVSPALGSPPPYVMNLPLVALGGVSVQELVGWGVAVTLSYRLAERLLERAGVAAGPHRVAFVAAFVMASICLAVESAAISSGWWTWTLRVPSSGLVRVPPVALLDWGFVAFDVLLAYLLFASEAGWRSRLAALLLFPAHFASHLLVKPLSAPLPVTGWALVHAGIAAYVAARALSSDERPGSAAASKSPTAGRSRLGLVPPLGALVVAGCSAVAAFAVGGSVRAALAALPLAALALVALAPPRRAAWPIRPLSRGRAAALCGGVALVLVLAVAVPAARRSERLVAAVRAGQARLNAGDAAGAETELRRAVAARPEHAGVRTVLAWTLLRLGRRDEARAELLEALRHEPAARDALVLLATLDAEAGRFEEAEARLVFARRVYPADGEVARLAAEVARRSASRP